MTISHPRWWRSVRTRALISAISLAALSVIFAGVVAYSLERQRIEQTAQSELFSQLDAARALRSPMPKECWRPSWMPPWCPRHKGPSLSIPTV